jgi:hypothetical protein
MSTQPKHKLGEDVSVDFMGKVVSVHLTWKGDVQYKVDGDNGNSAYVAESNIFPLPTPEDFPELNKGANHDS